MHQIEWHKWASIWLHIKEIYGAVCRKEIPTLCSQPEDYFPLTLPDRCGSATSQSKSCVSDSPGSTWIHNNSSTDVVWCHSARRLFCCWAAWISQAGAADLRQPGWAVRQAHEHHLYLGPQRSHHLLHHCEWSTHFHSPTFWTQDICHCQCCHMETLRCNCFTWFFEKGHQIDAKKVNEYCSFLRGLQHLLWLCWW